VISSPNNEKIKFARSLTRKKERAAAQQFLVEGTRLMEEASRAGSVPALIFYERSAFDTDARLRQLVVNLRRSTREVYEVTTTVLRALSDTESPQGIAAVYPLPQPSPAPETRLTLVLDRVRDPGNLGAILRTAWAAGVDRVLLAPGTADLFNPKVVRAGMGAHFSLAAEALTWQEITLQVAGVPRIYLADANGTVPYTAADWTAPVGLIVGGETEGPSEEARRLATATVSIPMRGRTESLNAGVAAGILLFQAIRSL
jgi:TrmH family RNA methyltransferase